MYTVWIMQPDGTGVYQWILDSSWPDSVSATTQANTQAANMGTQARVEYDTSYGSTIIYTTP